VLKIIVFSILSGFLVANTSAREVLRAGKGPVKSFEISLEGEGMGVEEVMEALNEYTPKTFSKNSKAYTMTERLLQEFQLVAGFDEPANPIIQSIKSSSEGVRVKFNLKTKKPGSDKVTVETMSYDYRSFKKSSGSRVISTRYIYSWGVNLLIKAAAVLGLTKEYVIPKVATIEIVPLKSKNAIQLNINVETREACYKDQYEKFAKEYKMAAENTFRKFILPEILAN
jgi:hypothetical protein